ncbi:MAG TPA: hypothetical protein VFZ62_01600 [Candidatus Saccharimonadales bacterium]
MDSKQRKTPVGGARVMRKNQWRIVIFLVAALVILTAGLVVLKEKTKQEKQSSTHAMTVASVCDESVLKNAAHALERGDAEEMARVSSDIKNHNEYSIDPNCLYVLVKNAILRGDAQEGGRYFRLLEGVYDADRGLAVVLQDVASVDALRDELARLAAL